MTTTRKLGSYFVKGKRNNGETFVTCTDDRPEWLHDAIHEAHGSDLPDDWVYAECEAACDAIDDGSLTGDDSVHEFADARVDVYTRDLYRWAADKCLSDTYASAESDASDCGMPDETEKRIAIIQYHAIARIARTILAARDEHANDGDNASAESEA